MAAGSNFWNIKNAIKSSLETRETPMNIHKNVNKHAKSSLRYDRTTGKIERKDSHIHDVDKELEREDRINKLKEKLKNMTNDINEVGRAKPGKGVSYKQQSDYISNFASLNRRNLQAVISELRSLGCTVTPTKTGYVVKESVEKREFTNEDIKNMKLKIYEAYHDGRILSEDKDELFMLLEKAIENYNKESME